MNFQPLKDFLDYYLPMLGIPGSDTVIYRNHEELFRYQSGFDNINLRTPVRKDALYNIYSCSKVATAVAATQIIERGELLPTDPLYAYIPEFKNIEVKVFDENGNVKNTKKAETPILIRHLLTMTSGMGYNLNMPSIKRVIEHTNGIAPTLDVCRAIAEEPLDFEPGENYQYSLSLDVMAGVIEVISGMKFRDYMKENIFEPLGMKDTSYHYEEEKMSRLATHYKYDASSGTAVVIPLTDMPFRFGTEYDSGGAGIVSSVDDCILLTDALASGGVGKNGNRILSKYGIDLMRSNALTEKQINSFASLQNIGYGYGYGVRTCIDPHFFGNLSPLGEFGWDGEKLCYMSSSPETGISIFHTEHMGGLSSLVIPRLRNLLYSCIGE